MYFLKIVGVSILQAFAELRLSNISAKRRPTNINSVVSNLVLRSRYCDHGDENNG